MRLITLIFLLIAPSFVAADIVDENAKLSGFSSINIAIGDDAKNGCWTNIAEVRSYAEGKLELAGATVSYDRSNNQKLLFENEETFFKVNI